MEHGIVRSDESFSNVETKNRPSLVKSNCNDATSEMAEIMPYSSVNHLNKHEMLCNEDATVHSFYEIIFGHVQSYIMLSDGRRLVTGFFRKGDFIGLPIEERHSFSAQALTRTDVRSYSTSQLKKLISQSPKVAQKIIYITQEKLCHATEQTVMLGRKSPTEKLASFLTTLERWPTNKAECQAILHMPMSLTDIGDYLGLTKETVCRTLRKFRQVGLVETRLPHQLYISDLDILYSYSYQEK